MLRTIALLVAGLMLALLPAATAADRNPVRVLLVTGGCCHNYPFQTQQLTNAVAKLAAVNWTIVMEGGSGTRAEISLYDQPDWARGYDVVVHNECFADTTNQTYIRKITNAHKAGVPAAVIHCAMHTYRATDMDDWREFLGVTSRRHDHQSKYPVTLVEPGHPILKGISDKWVTGMDELYVIEKLWPNTKALATSVSEQDGKTYPVAWVSQFGKARIFGTTYGHSDEAWRDADYLTLVSRGVLWLAGGLGK